MTLEIGDKVPDFNVPTDSNDHISLSDYRGKTLVLYFYPKDDTSGCTKQACAFRDDLSRFNEMNCCVVGVSKDSVKKHDKFKNKYDLNFPLLSDEGNDICERYGVWKEKSMYGKTYMGIERTTFLIDDNGVIQKIWRKVKVNDHIEDILSTLSAINKKAA